jgi:hypothetical protein
MPYEDDGIFQLTTQPQIIGYRSRMWSLDDLIRHAKAKGDVGFATGDGAVAVAHGERLSGRIAIPPRLRSTSGWP